MSLILAVCVLRVQPPRWYQLDADSIAKSTGISNSGKDFPDMGGQRKRGQGSSRPSCLNLDNYFLAALCIRVWGSVSVGDSYFGLSFKVSKPALSNGASSVPQAKTRLLVTSLSPMNWRVQGMWRNWSTIKLSTRDHPLILGAGRSRHTGNAKLATIHRAKGEMCVVWCWERRENQATCSCLTSLSRWKREKLEVTSILVLSETLS